MNQTIKFHDAIRAGIRHADYPGSNQQWFAECIHARACADGLRPFNIISQPFTDAYFGSGQGNLGQSKAWPFPQLFIGRGVTLLVFEDTVFVVIETGSDWTAVQYATYDAAEMGAQSPQSASISSGGGSWHFMDFWNSWMLANGQSVVIRAGADNKVYTANAPTIRTVGTWQGRTVFGGFDTSDFATLVDWEDLLDPDDTRIPASIRAALNSFGQTIGQSWVWFGTPRGGDALWFHSMNAMIYGNTSALSSGFDADNPWHERLDKRALNGFLPMPFQGEVARVLQLGPNMMVYGQIGADYKRGGSAFLFDHGGDVGCRAIPGMPAGLGIASRSAAGGDDTVHGLIDEDGALWIVTPEPKATWIGCKSKFSAMLGNDIVVSIDSAHRELHVADGVVSYVITEGGAVSRETQICTTIQKDWGVWFLDQDDALVVDVVTERFSPEFAGTGSLDYVRIMGRQDSGNPITVAVDYRMSNADDWTRTAFVALDGRGFARFHAPGAMWRVAVASNSWLKLSVDDIEVGVSDGKTDMTAWVSAPTPGAASE